MIRLRVDGLDQVQRALRDLGKATSDRIIQRALQRAGKAMSTLAQREVRDELNLKVDDVKRVVTLRKPSKSQPETTLFVSHKPIRLAHYGARQTKRGVTVKVKRKGRRVRVARAFLLTTASGKQVLLQREGKERLPIKKLFGPEPYQVIRQRKLEPVIAKRGAAVFAERFAHEFRREVEKIAAGRVSSPST